jgi:DNA-binding HxlR family transcriptional regulator
VQLLGERWTFLILREAFGGVTHFADFKDALGIAPDVLSERLTSLVEGGVMTREPYQELGTRVRFSYELTQAGRELQTVLGALQQWGDDHLPHSSSPTMLRRSRPNDAPLRVGFVDDSGRAVLDEDVMFVRSPTHPSRQD